MDVAVIKQNRLLCEIPWIDYKNEPKIRCPVYCRLKNRLFHIRPINCTEMKISEYSMGIRKEAIFTAFYPCFQMASNSLHTFKFLLVHSSAIFHRAFPSVFLIKGEGRISFDNSISFKIFVMRIAIEVNLKISPLSYEV